MKKYISLILFAVLLNPSYVISQGYPTYSELAPSHRTYYDIQSNGSPHLIQLDPSYPSTNIHAVFQSSPQYDSLNSSRRVIFCFSEDNGVTWTDYGPHPPQYRSGFPVLQLLSDGSALIGMNTAYGSGIDRAQWFADVAPGAGTFVQLDPGIFTTPTIWPIGITTNSISNQTKFVFVAGNSRNRGLSLTSSNFSGYISDPEISYSFQCAFAKSSTGKIGLAYIMEGSVTQGRVSFKESSDDGVTWSSPVLIWDPILNNGNGAYNGIDVAYQGDTPNIVFETVKYVSNQPDIHSTARIQFWSPAVNSGIPVVLDSSNNMTAPNPQSDGYAPVCRPVIGTWDRIVVAYSKARTDVLDSNNYFDIYYSYSGNSGNSWITPQRITNNSGSLKDNRYVSISSKNNSNPSPNFHLVFQQDSIPGSFINGAEKSLAKIMYCKIIMPSPPYGIQNIGTEIPNAFKLKQNYPNPFNPKTNIDFDIPKESGVKVTVYNSLGEITAVLVDQSLNAGSYRVDWDANQFASGIYFYSINAGEFYEAKKMILLK